jgi:hypothetical protein
MITTTETDALLDAIDWDTPTSSRVQTIEEPAVAKDSALYEFISTAAELIKDDEEWKLFTAAFDHYERSRGRRTAPHLRAYRRSSSAMKIYSTAEHVQGTKAEWRPMRNNYY